MATAAQSLANQANAQFSSGPRTDAGKAAASQNASTHGLTGKRFVILPGQEEEFAAFSEGLEAEFHPEGPYQQFLFRQILHAAWNLERCHAAEAELAIAGLASGTDPLLVETNEARLLLIILYASRSERTLAKAVQELRRVQTELLYRCEISIGDTDHSPLAEFKAVVPQLSKENLNSERAKLAAIRAHCEAPPPSCTEPKSTSPSPAPAAAPESAPAPQPAKREDQVRGGFSRDSIFKRNKNHR